MLMVPTKLALRFRAEADNINKERYAFPFGRSQVRMTTAGLHVKLVRRDITRSKVCPCCRSTHHWAAADLLSSRMVALTRLTQREVPLPQRLLRKHFFLVIPVDRWVWSAYLNGHWWQLWGSSRCVSSGAGMGAAVGAPLRDWRAWGGIWGCNRFCDWELNWFNTGTNPKSSAVWKTHSCQSTFSSKMKISLTQKETETLSWNPTAFYVKIYLLTSLSFSGQLFIDLLIFFRSIVTHQMPWAAVNNAS